MKYYNRITGWMDMGAKGKISFQAASEYHKGLLSVKTEV